MTQQIIPEKSLELREFDSLYKIWKLDRNAALPEFKIENIRFVHDPHWRENWLSVQYVGDGGRALIKGIAQPYVSVAGAAEDFIFWAWFDLLNKQDKTYRPKSLPPKLAPA
jgi:hypothetical protein